MDLDNNLELVNSKFSVSNFLEGDAEHCKFLDIQLLNTEQAKNIYILHVYSSSLYVNIYVLW